MISPVFFRFFAENSLCCAKDFEDDVKGWGYVTDVYEALVDASERM